MLERCCPFRKPTLLLEPIGLLFPDALSADRSSVANPQLKLQLGEQTPEPAGVSVGVLAEAHPHATGFEVLVEVCWKPG
jgi:hypothetical protein